MSQDLTTQLREVYTGEAGEAWARIERERPATYWEENAVLGRQDMRLELLKRLQPIAGRLILDAGCGRGVLARSLAREGAVVTAVDLIDEHILEARTEADDHGVDFIVGDFRDALTGTEPFDDIILQEVLEDYRPDERLETIFQLADSRSRRIHLIFRQRGRWGGLINSLLPEVVTPTLEAVSLFRSIHLHTPYRLSHQNSIRRRSYNVQWAEFSLPLD
ncbi:MAG: methyltransferase domain-containing protein [Gemmatimonadota bacterium]|nr:methyltransferase domain-containing protein [Gemmatimonadota bacterium]